MNDPKEMTDNGRRGPVETHKDLDEANRHPGHSASEKSGGAPDGTGKNKREGSH